MATNTNISIPAYINGKPNTSQTATVTTYSNGNVVSSQTTSAGQAQGVAQQQAIQARSTQPSQSSVKFLDKSGNPFTPKPASGVLWTGEGYVDAATSKPASASQIQDAMQAQYIAEEEARKPKPASIPVQTISSQPNPIRNVRGEVVGYDTGKQSVLVKSIPVSGGGRGISESSSVADVMRAGNEMDIIAKKTGKENNYFPSSLKSNMLEVRNVLGMGTGNYQSFITDTSTGKNYVYSTDRQNLIQVDVGNNPYGPSVGDLPVATDTGLFGRLTPSPKDYSSVEKYLSTHEVINLSTKKPVDKSKALDIVSGVGAEAILKEDEQFQSLAFFTGGGGSQVAGVATNLFVRGAGVIGSVALNSSSKVVSPFILKTSSKVPSLFNIGERGVINVAGKASTKAAPTVSSVTSKLLSGPAIEQGLVKLTTAESKVVQSTLASNLAKQAGSSMYRSTGGNIVSNITGFVSKPTTKKIISWVGVQAATEVGYQTAPLMPGAARGATATFLNVVDQSSVYSPSAEDKSLVSEGWANVNRRLFGGTNNLVDEAGDPVLDEKGNQKTSVQAGIVNPIEGFFYTNIPSTKVFGQTSVIREELTAVIKKTKGYQEAKNKESYLKKALLVEGIAGPLGGLAGQVTTEFSSELRISNEARVAIPFFTKAFKGRERLGLVTGLGVSSLDPGYHEGGTTIMTMAAGERQAVSAETVQLASLYGMGSATAVNVILGGTFPYIKQKLYTGAVTKTTAKGVVKEVAPAKWSIPKIAHYGTQAVAYFYDPLEFGVDKVIAKTGMKESLGLTVGVSSNIFVPSYSTATQAVSGGGKTNLVVGTKNIGFANNKSNLLNGSQPSPFKGFGSYGTLTQNTSGKDIVGNGKDIVGNGKDIVGGGKEIVGGGNIVLGDSIVSGDSFIDNRTNNQTDTFSQTNIISSTNTNTSNMVNVPTIVSPFVPFLPFMGLPGGDAFGAKSSGRKRTKYYNELSAAGQAFRGLDFGLVPYTKKGKPKKARTMQFGSHKFTVGKQKVSKQNTGRGLIPKLNFKRI